MSRETPSGRTRQWGEGPDQPWRAGGSAKLRCGGFVERHMMELTPGTVMKGSTF